MSPCHSCAQTLCSKISRPLYDAHSSRMSDEHKHAFWVALEVFTWHVYSVFRYTEAILYKIYIHIHIYRIAIMVPYHHSDTMVIFFCNQIIFFSSNFFYPKKTRNYKEQISILCGCLQEKISNGFSILWPSPSHGSKCVWKKNLATYAAEDFPVILDFSC